eukprot:jgi/Mesvir1/12355/Mv00538-RA.1
MDAPRESLCQHAAAGQGATWDAGQGTHAPLLWDVLTRLGCAGGDASADGDAEWVLLQRCWLARYWELATKLGIHAAVASSHAARWAATLPPGGPLAALAAKATASISNLAAAGSGQRHVAAADTPQGRGIDGGRPLAQLPAGIAVAADVTGPGGIASVARADGRTGGAYASTGGADASAAASVRTARLLAHLAHASDVERALRQMAELRVEDLVLDALAARRRATLMLSRSGGGAAGAGLAVGAWAMAGSGAHAHPRSHHAAVNHPNVRHHSRSQPEHASTSASSRSSGAYSASSNGPIAASASPQAQLPQGQPLAGQLSREVQAGGHHGGHRLHDHAGVVAGAGAGGPGVDAFGLPRKQLVALVLSEDEAEEVRFRCAWLVCHWRRAVELGIEPDIAEDRLRLWIDRLQSLSLRPAVAPAKLPAMTSHPSSSAPSLPPSAVSSSLTPLCLPDARDFVDAARGVAELRQLGIEGQLWRRERHDMAALFLAAAPSPFQGSTTPFEGAPNLAAYDTKGAGSLLGSNSSNPSGSNSSNLCGANSRRSAGTLPSHNVSREPVASSYLEPTVPSGTTDRIMGPPPRDAAVSNGGGGAVPPHAGERQNCREAPAARDRDIACRGEDTRAGTGPKTISSLPSSSSSSSSNVAEVATSRKPGDPKPKAATAHQEQATRHHATSCSSAMQVEGQPLAASGATHPARPQVGCGAVPAGAMERKLSLVSQLSSLSEEKSSPSPSGNRSGDEPRAVPPKVHLSLRGLLSSSGANSPA